MGPLQGVRIVEIAALGPAPMGAMILADMGAEVIRIERKTSSPSHEAEAPIFDPTLDILNRNRRIISLDLKQPEAVEAALQLICRADILIEGFRPGVMEKLGLGPNTCLARQPALVYGRMTGWGQSGPWANQVGHDINYLSLSGALHAVGEAGGKPVVPLNVVADGGGGAMLLAVGLLAALLHARQTGEGQVVDAAMTDGSALLMSMIHTLKAMGNWQNTRGTNLLDGGAHFYASYTCQDGRWLSVGAIENRFYRRFLEKMAAITTEDLSGFANQWDRKAWPTLKEQLATLFLTRPRDEWCALLGDAEVCVTPILDLDEAPLHPHHQSRQTFIEVGGVMQAAPAPRFSRTQNALPTPPGVSSLTRQHLQAWGLSAEALASLQQAGVCLD